MRACASDRSFDRSFVQYINTHFDTHRGTRFMQYEANVNGDVGVSDIAQRLRSRGIEVEWSCKTKFQTGGMTFVLASHTQPIS